MEVVAMMEVFALQMVVLPVAPAGNAGGPGTNDVDEVGFAGGCQSYQPWPVLA